jgi:hypothetical protein
MNRELLVLSKSLTALFKCSLIGFLLASCTGQLQDPMNLSSEPQTSDQFESWDPESVTAPGPHLLTFTEGDAATSFPYYNKNKTYPIKFIVNTSTTTYDPGVYKVKLQYSINGGTTWGDIAGAEEIPVSDGITNTYNWLIPNSLADGSDYRIKMISTAVSGESSSAESSRSFIIDSAAPTASTFSLKLGSLGVQNAISINRSFFGFSLAATDSLSPIQSYCLKYDNTTLSPDALDDCWVQIDSTQQALTYNQTDLPGFIGFVAGSYTLRIWVQDAAGNISNLTSGTGQSGVDMLDVAYNPASAPVISNVIISNNNSTSLSPSKAELTMTAGQTVYVRWRVQDSDLVSNPVSVTYTTDDKVFTDVVTLQNLTNANQGGCSIDANYTGCATFAAPTSNYFRVQITALDQAGLISKGGSSGANMQNIQLIFGNTDQGLGGSANKAVFLTKTALNSSSPESGILAVTKRGAIFYLDRNRGILLVDPQDGAQKIYIPRSTTSTGDGGLYSAATTSKTFKISLDYKDRLLIFERDRIRRVEANGTINTIIGGGAVRYTDNIDGNGKIAAINALQYKLEISENSDSTNTSYYMFQPLPNGNIWFSLNHNGTFNNAQGIMFGIYKQADNKVYFLGLKGEGASGNSTYSLTASQHYVYSTPALTFDYRTSEPRYLTMYFCRSVPGGCNWASSNFNPKTGQNVGYGVHYPMTMYWGTGAYIASRKGELFALSRYYPPALFKLNYANLQWDRKLGTAGSTGSCLDGTLATACEVDLADAYITENGTTYFVDRGGVVRVILPNKEIKTLFGQSLSYGDGSSPLSARLGNVNWLGTWDSDSKVIVYDESEKYVRESSRGAGSLVTRLCGNGQIGGGIYGHEPIASQMAVNRPCFSGYWGRDSQGMTVDRRNGEVYVSSGSVGKLLRSGPDAGKFKRLVGSNTWSKCFQSHDGDFQDGYDVTSCGYPISIFGLWHADTYTTSSGQGAVENGTSEAFVLMSTQNWNGTQLFDAFNKLGRGDNGSIRHIAGLDESITSGWLTSVGANYTATSGLPIYTSHASSKYVPENRSALLGVYGSSVIIQTPMTRNGSDQITGAGLIGANYNLNTAYTSYNYKWNVGQINYIYYCGTNGFLYRYNPSVPGSHKICPFPKNSANQDMISCYGYSLEWDATKTKLLFPVRQNGLTAVAEYEVSGCN